MMHVFITVDVETYSGDYEKDVYGYGKGLPYILGVLNRAGVTGTFFVEALGATTWGAKPLKKVCATIQDSGHEIQLHLHPKVADIGDVRIPDDRLWQCDKTTQRRLIEIGLKVLYDCGVQDVKAFRAGDLAANEDTLLAMKETGLAISSNRDLDLKSSIHTKINDFFPIRNDFSFRYGVYDLPVTAFKSPIALVDGPYRHFSPCALGAYEMKDALLKMARSGYSSATVMIHPGEFFRKSGKNTDFVLKNCNRLESLIEFIKANDYMKTLTVKDCISEIRIPSKSPPMIKLNFKLSMIRFYEQLLDRISAVIRKK